MDDELAAKTEEAGAGNKEVKERLNPEMQRELCFAVLCERMHSCNYRERMYFDAVDPTIVYDPKLAFEYILRGKEQYQALMDLCKAMKNLEVEQRDLAIKFDKNVCATESDPEYRVDDRTFQLLDSFFVKKFLKHVRRLDVSYSKGKCSDFFYSHLTEMQNLEELVIQGCFGSGSQLTKLLKMNPLRSIEADWRLFKEFDGGVTDYKLEKMVIKDCKMEDAFTLSNFYPHELRLQLRNRDALGNVSENKAFAEVAKLSIFKNYCTPSEHTLFVQVQEMLSFAEQFIDSFHEQFPKIEELVFEFRIGIFQFLELDLHHPQNQFKVFTDLCSEFVKKYQKKLKVKFVFCLWDRLSCDGLNVHEYLMKQLPNQKFEVVDEIGLTNCLWKNRCSLSEAVVVDCSLSIILNP